MKNPAINCAPSMRCFFSRWGQEFSKYGVRNEETPSYRAEYSMHVYQSLCTEVRKRKFARLGQKSGRAARGVSRYIGSMNSAKWRWDDKRNTTGILYLRGEIDEADWPSPVQGRSLPFIASRTETRSPETERGGEVAYAD